MLTPAERVRLYREVHQLPLDAVAEAEGVSRTIVSQVLRGLKRSPRVEAAIAEAIGMPVDRCFPPRVYQRVPSRAA